MDNIFFRTLITKSLVASKTDSDERFFEGVLTVEMKDKQGESNCGSRGPRGLH